MITHALAEQPFEGTAGISEFLEALDRDWELECTLPTPKKAGTLTLIIRE